MFQMLGDKSMQDKIMGYAGKELWVDLSGGALEVRALDAARMRKFLGGAGYCADVLFRELSAGLDPLSEKNMLIFATGPLSLQTVPGGGSVTLCYKSPATKIWGEARCGGNFGPDMKRAGFDFIMIHGRSSQPVYLEVVQGRARLRDASHLTGKDVHQKCEIMKQSVQGGDKKHTSAMVIGLAGENQLMMASVMCGDRAAGRGGCGALMGNKNLLGVVVSGNMPLPMADQPAVMSTVRDVNQRIRQNDVCSALKSFGTVGDLGFCDEGGDMPTQNWRSNNFGKSADIHDAYYEKIFIQNKACYSGCPVGCGRVVQVKDGKFQTPVHEGCEYESMAAFTAFVMNENPELSAYCGYLCNLYGVDTISAGSMIAFAMECYEKGIITEADIGGVPLIWGDATAIVHTLHMLVRREHIGDILAEGVREAARRLGNGAEAFAVHVKGLEGPAHDPRSGKMLGLTYGTGNRGMCHIHPFEGMGFDRGKMSWGMIKYGVRDPETMDRWDEAGKGKDCKILQDGLISPDVLGTCKFLMYTGVTLDDWAAMLSSLTGWDVDGAEILETCERIYNLQRLFNVREGITREDDRLPQRVLQMPAFGAYASESDCVIHDYESLLDEYYEARGWDLRGRPLQPTLAALGLQDYMIHYPCE